MAHAPTGHTILVGQPRGGFWSCDGREQACRPHTDSLPQQLHKPYSLAADQLRVLAQNKQSWRPRGLKTLTRPYMYMYAVLDLDGGGCV